MRIVILTENEPFHSADCFRRLFEILPDDVEVALTVITDFSPNGGATSRIATNAKIAWVFGLLPFLHAAWRYVRTGVGQTRKLKSLFLEKRSLVLSGVRNVNSGEILSAIRQAKPDLIVSVTMHHLFGPELLSLAPCVNLHLSLLPNHRGLMPVFWALHEGDKETGVTVHIVDQKIDHGEILVQKRVPILTRRLDQLYRELKLEGMEALAKAIGLMTDYNAETGAQPLNCAMKAIKQSVRGAPQRKDVRSFMAAGNHLF